MDQMALLERLDRLAGVCRRFGLSGLPPAGKNLLKPFMPRPLSVRVDGFDIEASIEHRHYLQALQKDEVESLMTQVFNSVIRPGSVVLDIGAFVGWYTLLAARRAGPRGKVYAFEPDARNYAWLTENIRRNQVDDRVILVPKAISDKSGSAAFYLHGGDQSRSGFFPTASGTEATVVSTVVLDDLIDNTVKPDVVKMDVEGGEVRALTGMKQVLARNDRDIKLFVECNPSSLRIAGTSHHALIASLRELGFSILIIDESMRRLKPLDSSVETAKYVNFYCTRRG